MKPDVANVVNDVPERFVPDEMGGGLIEAEHLNRYWFAAEAVEGKRVLDAGCGTAYGSAILADAGAAEVVGVDLAEDVLAAVSGGLPSTVSLQAADVCELPFEDGSFDVVVCFEVLEHIGEPERALDEFSRVLRDDGVLLVSSPNRSVFPPGNPHHVHEFTPDELAEAVSRRFGTIVLWRQQDWTVSAILDDASFEQAGDRALEAVKLRKIATRAPNTELYTLALAGNGRLPDLSASFVLTSSTEVRRWLDEIADLRAQLDAARRLVLSPEERAELGELRPLRQTVADQQQHLQALQKSLSSMRKRQAELRSLLLDAHAEAAERDEQTRAQFEREIKPREEELAWLRGIVRQRDKDLGWLTKEHERVLAAEIAERDALAQSRAVRIASSYWRLRDWVKRVGRGGR